MYQVIANIPDIPDYTQWSKPSSAAQHLAQASPDLQQAKISARSSAAQKIILEKKTRDIDGLGDPLDMERWSITDATVVNRIANQLGFRNPSGRVQVLTPGAMVPLHHDDLAFGYIDGREASYQHQRFSDQQLADFARDPQCAQRVLIMLEDSLPGQLLIFGDQVCSHWQRGDVIHWDWINVEHATINAGYWSRPLLRLTGLVDPDWLLRYRQ